MLGCAGAHSYIITDIFVCDNSDGSGPNKFGVENEEKVTND
jgi:hypothetical protein